MGRAAVSSGTAQAVLDHAEPDARLIFSCGWHITQDGNDHYSRRFKIALRIATRLAHVLRFAEIDDQLEACRRIFASDRRWTVVRGSDLEEGESQGLPVWSRHVGDPILASNLTRRVDFALFMIEALTDDTLIHETPAIVGRLSPSAQAHAGQSTTVIESGLILTARAGQTQLWPSGSPPRCSHPRATGVITGVTALHLRGVEIGATEPIRVTTAPPGRSRPNHADLSPPGSPPAPSTTSSRPWPPPTGFGFRARGLSKGAGCCGRDWPAASPR